MALKNAFIKETDELTEAEWSMILTFLFWNPVECFLELTNSSLVSSNRIPLSELKSFNHVLHNLERFMVK
jgi:hypothetical protein